MAGFKITKKELRNRIGYIILGFFTYYLVSPIQQIIDGSTKVQVLIGLVGIALTLYFFDFDK
jgi:hypothetical protein